MTQKSLTLAEHFRWMQTVLADPAFTAAQKVILIRLALHLNLKSGRCDPSIETVARGAALKSRAVQATFAKAQRLDYLIRFEGGGRGKTSGYCLVLKEADSSSETLHSNAPFTETLHGQTLNGGVQNGAPPRGKPCTAVHPNTENKKNTDFDHDFDRWYSVYPKHRARAKARQAFERIVGGGKATVEELIAGAVRYAAERAGQHWRYTKDPATWLNGDCWLDEPAPGGDEPEPQTEPQQKIAVGGRGRDPWL